jgi:hypothetical protein
METSPFIVSFPSSPPSVWAARPLASGARLSLIARRSVSSVGVGCPSFGGQRTVSDRSFWPLAIVGTFGQPRRFAGRWVPVVKASRAEAAMTAATAKRVNCSTKEWAVAGRRSGTVAALGKVKATGLPSVGLTETANTKQPARRSRAGVWRHCVVQHGAACTVGVPCTSSCKVGT